MKHKAGMAWDPDRYHQFQTERAAPFEDLVKLIQVRPGLRVIDLGCGTGELTRRLADLLPGSDTLGIDSSAEMLERAQVHARDGLRFELRPIERQHGTFDLIFSHAALQWIPRHDELLPRLWAMLEPNGQIAVQVPSNYNHPAHVLIRDIAAESPFRDIFAADLRDWGVLEISDYAQILWDCGAKELTTFEKVYPHVLENADAMADWTSGTALVPYMQKLHRELQQLFMARYRAALRRLFPGSPLLYPFRRTLLAATRGEAALDEGADDAV